MKAVFPVAIQRFEECSPHWIDTANSLTMGYWISFASEFISGFAVLVPCGSGVEELRNRPAPQLITVETGVKAYKGFRLLADNETHAEYCEPSPNPGDYDLVGQIWHILTDETNGELISAKIFIGSLGFELGREDVAGVEIEEGTWVRFQVQELTLYDVNY